jgi:hypothetical protein
MMLPERAKRGSSFRSRVSFLSSRGLKLAMMQDHTGPPEAPEGSGYEQRAA